MSKQKGRLFGKPRSEVIKHPGVFRKAAEAAGESTAEFAHEHLHDKGRLGSRARLAKALMGMHHKKG